MSALAGLRPQRFTARSYVAFRVGERLQHLRANPASCLGELAAGDIVEALAAALRGEYESTQGLFHKSHLAIVETDEDGEARVYLYAIRRKSTPRYVFDRNHRQRAVHDLYPELVAVLPSELFAIRRPVAEGRAKAERDAEVGRP